MKRERICDVAERVLRELEQPGVAYGDSGLLDEIAKRAGVVVKRGRYALPNHPLDRWQRVLNALSRQPGNLVQRYFRLVGKRVGRVFYLPEHAP